MHDLVVLPDEPYRFTAADGPEVFAGRPVAPRADVAAVLANPAFREQQITGKGWRTMPVGPKEFETSVREYRQVLEKMFRAAKVVPQ